MFFRKKSVPKTPLYDRLTATTLEKVSSYVEAHKSRTDDLVETSALLLVMNMAGHFLSGDPSLLNKTNRDVLAFEVFVFSFFLLEKNFGALGSEPVDEEGETFRKARALGVATVALATGWDSEELFLKRQMQYAGAWTTEKVIARFVHIASSIGAITRPGDQYGEVSSNLMEGIKLQLAATSFATSLPEAAADTLLNIMAQYD